MNGLFKAVVKKLLAVFASLLLHDGPEGSDGASELLFFSFGLPFIWKNSLGCRTSPEFETGIIYSKPVIGPG